MNEKTTPTAISIYLDDIKKANKIKLILKEAYLFQEGENQNCFWFLKGKNCSVFYYKTKKLFFQGKEASYFFNLVEVEDSINVDETVLKYPVCGTDEAGKGDYFGPLITAGVLVTKENLKDLQQLNITDSKKIEPNRLSKLSFEIKKIVKFSIIVLNNAKYNEVYRKLKNMNKILSYSHYLAIVNLYKKSKFQNVIVDKFGNADHLKWLLRNFTYNLAAVTKGERFLPVAAASIIAKDRFNFELRKLNIEYDFEFKPGASNEVKKLVEEFKKSRTKEEINKVLKLNFKI